MANSLFLILGIVLCSLVVVQLALWTATSFVRSANNRKQFELSRDLLRRQIESAASQKTIPAVEKTDGSWKGFRQFKVARLIRETETCSSVYFQPTDGKSICGYEPGQHLTLRFNIPGHDKPRVRCYSLSQASTGSEYRISAKICPPPKDKPNAPVGLVSHYINRELLEGDLVDIKAPSGHFCLDTSVQTPVVMLAAGIGVTPLLSMLEWLSVNQPERQAILFYGSRCGSDHAFKSRLSEINRQCENITILDIYSNPEPSDRQGVDFLCAGRVTPELIQKILPGLGYHFYMCGPPTFMETLHNGLVDAGVPQTRIFFEAFGPASIGKKRDRRTDSGDSHREQEVVNVSFVQSGVDANWKGGEESLLALAEAHGVAIDSGCRAGSCGTCEVAVKSGKVKYVDGQAVDCSPEHCLVCIAQPDGPVELEA